MLEALLQDPGSLAAATAVLGFLFGVLTSSLTEVLKRAVERDRLIALICAEIHRNWKELNRFTSVPDGTHLARSKLELKGISGVSFTGIPEYEFEVYNLKLFENEGIRLALHLSKQARRDFWDTFSLMRDAEAVRQLLKQLPESNTDRSQYQVVFRGLIGKLDESLRQLEESLQRDRSFLVRLID